MRGFLALLGIVSGLAALFGAFNLVDSLSKTGPVVFQQIGAILLCGLPMVGLCVCVAGLAICSTLSRLAKEADTRPSLAASGARSGDWVNPKHADAQASALRPEN